jgi:spore germination cell wall hydrolase CwlJ-like protein
MYTAEECYPFALLTLCIWREARGESDDAKLGVAWTIKNRVALQGWMGKTYNEVVLKPWQFSSFNASDPNAVKWPNPLTDPSYAECMNAAKCAYSDIKTDPTSGATHYYDDSIAAPKWTAGATKTVKLGKLNFYKDVK